MGALAKILKLAAIGGFLAATATLTSGCGFQPLYGPTASGAQLEDIMRTVDISPVPGRVGQQVRNELIFKTTGGGLAGDSQYRLDIAIRESVVNLLVEGTGNIEGQVYQLYSEFKLVRIEDNEVVLSGHSNSRAAFDKVGSVFADIRAQRDAENRAAKTIAETIRTRLASYLSLNA